MASDLGTQQGVAEESETWKTVWKGTGGGRSRVHSAKQAKHRAMPRVDSGIPQPASLQALLRKSWLPKLNGSEHRKRQG